MTEFDYSKFLDAATRAEYRHDLFIAPNAEAQRFAMSLLVQEALERGLHVMQNRSSGTVTIEGTKARFITAHKHMMQMLRGHYFTSLQGESYVTALPDGEEIIWEIKKRVR